MITSKAFFYLFIFSLLNNLFIFRTMRLWIVFAFKDSDLKSQFDGRRKIKTQKKTKQQQTNKTLMYKDNLGRWCFFFFANVPCSYLYVIMRLSSTRPWQQESTISDDRWDWLCDCHKRPLPTPLHNLCSGVGFPAARSSTDTCSYRTCVWGQEFNQYNSPLDKIYRVTAETPRKEGEPSAPLFRHSPPLSHVNLHC